MSVERTYQKDIDRFRLDRKRERAVRRARPMPKTREQVLEEVLRDLSLTLSKMEFELKRIKETLAEVKEVLITFGFKFERNEKLAKVALRYRKSSRERGRRFRERHGDEE